VQHVPHHQHVGRWQRIGKEIPALERQPAGEPLSRHVGLEMRPHRLQVETDAPEVRMRDGDLDRKPTLRGTHVGEGLIVSPWELRRHLEMANARLYPFWGGLTTALRTGEPQNEIRQGEKFFARLYADPQPLAGFLQAMTGLSQGAARVSRPPMSDGLVRSRKRPVAGVFA